MLGMAKFSTVDEFLNAVDTREQRAKVQQILDFVAETWPALELAVKWNQPMFLHHGTFIIGFSVFPKNIAVGLEPMVMERLQRDIETAGYTTTRRLFRISWDDQVDYALLTRIIELQIAEKADVSGLWRP